MKTIKLNKTLKDIKKEKRNSKINLHIISLNYVPKKKRHTLDLLCELVNYVALSAIITFFLILWIM